MDGKIVSEYVAYTLTGWMFAFVIGCLYFLFLWFSICEYKCLVCMYACVCYFSSLCTAFSKASSLSLPLPLSLLSSKIIWNGWHIRDLLYAGKCGLFFFFYCCLFFLFFLAFVCMCETLFLLGFVWLFFSLPYLCSFLFIYISFVHMLACLFVYLFYFFLFFFYFLVVVVCVAVQIPKFQLCLLLLEKK